MIEQENENPGALAGATGAEEIFLASEKPYVLGAAIASLKLEQALNLKPKGWYHITVSNGAMRIAVHRPGQPAEYIICLSPGHANRVRQELSDAGMAGLIEGAL